MCSDTKFKIIHYESTEGKLTGTLGWLLAPHYRIGTLVRAEEYPDFHAIRAVLNWPKQD